jgi:hypothetical protein
MRTVDLVIAAADGSGTALAAAVETLQRDRNESSWCCVLATRESHAAFADASAERRTPTTVR